jgi:hypothetical protein
MGIDVRERLIVGIAHDVTAVYLLGTPWRWEMAGNTAVKRQESLSLNCDLDWTRWWATLIFDDNFYLLTAVPTLESAHLAL